MRAWKRQREREGREAEREGERDRVRDRGGWSNLLLQYAQTLQMFKRITFKGGDGLNM